MSKDTIRIDTWTYIPALGTSLRLGIFELCADVLYGISRVHWEDNFFGYISNWKSKALGYENKAGLASSLGKFFGFEFPWRLTLLPIFSNIAIWYNDRSAPNTRQTTLVFTP